ncbi:hypothetical protein FHG87_011261 [Trinorchestia longiramus]|nr:hypothetical protein FHG87_011261 [Trinorchestia longiramus]
MLKWTLRSSSTGNGRRTSAGAPSRGVLEPDTRCGTGVARLRDSNKCWSETQVKVAQVKSTLKLNKEKRSEKTIEETFDSLEYSSNYSSSKTSRSSLKSSKSSSTDSKEEKKRKKLSKSVRCATLDPLGLFSTAASDSDSGSVYMQLERTPVALLQPCLTSYGHEDPRRRPLIDLSNGDYSDINKHLQSVYLKHPLTGGYHPTLVTVLGNDHLHLEPTEHAEAALETTEGRLLSTINAKNRINYNNNNIVNGRNDGASPENTPDVVGCHKTCSTLGPRFVEKVPEISFGPLNLGLNWDANEAIQPAGEGDSKRNNEMVDCPQPLGTGSSSLMNETPLRHKKCLSLNEPGIVSGSRRSLSSYVSDSTLSKSKQFCEIGRGSGRGSRLLPRRLRPEVTNISKLNVLNEVSKRHSIAVFPKEFSRCSFKRKKRCANQARQEEGMSQKRIVDIHFDEDVDDKTLQSNPREAIHPPKYPASRTCLDSALEQIQQENVHCKNMESGSVPCSSVSDNTLYMTMRDVQTSDKSTTENIYKDIEPIYSTTKCTKEEDSEFNNASRVDYINENGIYLKMLRDDASYSKNVASDIVPQGCCDAEFKSRRLKNHNNSLKNNQILEDNSTAIPSDVEVRQTLIKVLRQPSDESSPDKVDLSSHHTQPPSLPSTSPSRRIINRQIIRNAAKDILRSQRCSFTHSKGVIRRTDFNQQVNSETVGPLPSPLNSTRLCNGAKSLNPCSLFYEVHSQESNPCVEQNTVEGLCNLSKLSDHVDCNVSQHSVVDDLPCRDSLSLSNAEKEFLDSPLRHPKTVSSQSFRNNSMSVLLDKVVHRNLFDSELASLTGAQENTGYLGTPLRRHSISSISEVSKELFKLSSCYNTTFWSDLSDMSVFLPTFRRASSESILCSQSDVPLASSVAKVLCQTQCSLLSISDNENQAVCSENVVSIRKGVKNQIRHVLGGKKNGRIVLPSSTAAGTQVSFSQRLKTSSGADLFNASPCNVTLELPDSSREKRCTRTMIESSVPAVAVCSEGVYTNCEANQGLTGAPPRPPLKVSDKLAQRQEESSYRLLRLFQDCSLDYEVESDREDWDSGEWSMLATLDENSTRDPALLDLSVALTNEVMKDPQILDSATASAINKLKFLSDDKMLAKLRKSFRRKDKEKIDPKAGKRFMFVDNPMYLSPEIKKEAKVISSGGCGSSLFFSNPTYSSPEIMKNRVRSYTRPRSDSTQCENENRKNLILAQASSKPLLHPKVLQNTCMMQCNPCYQYPKPARVNTCVAKQDTLPGLALSQEDINGDNILEHEYCTIPGDESDSWITQSSGSQQTNSSPSSKRHFHHSLSSLCLSSPQSRGRFVLSMNQTGNSQPKTEKAYKTSHIYANEPPVIPCKNVKPSTLHCAPSYASPRTPRPVKKSCLSREQFVFDEKPPAVPPPLPSRLRNNLRVHSSSRITSEPNSDAIKAKRSSGGETGLQSEDIHGHQIYNDETRFLRDSNGDTRLLDHISQTLDVQRSNVAYQLPPDSVYESITEAKTVNTQTIASHSQNELETRLLSEESKVSELQQKESQCSQPTPSLSPSNRNNSDTQCASKIAKSVCVRTPKTPARRCARPSFVTTPGAAKNALTSLGRGRRTPSRRPQKKYRARDVLEGKGPSSKKCSHADAFMRCNVARSPTTTGPPLVHHWSTTGPPLVYHWNVTSSNQH